MTDKIQGYWFADTSGKLPNGDNRKIVIGKKHSVKGEIIVCQHGLHCSVDPFDALQYAPGPMLYRVSVWGDVQTGNDKLCARHREYHDVRDATDMLRRFAREQALSVIHLWDAPEIVRQYLETGDETLRDTAGAAAWAAARAAARDTAGATAWDTAWAAAWAAARAAARAAAGAAAWAAAREAARERFNVLVTELFNGEG